MIPIGVLIRPITSDDIYTKAIALLDKVGLSASSWREGGVAKSIVGALCELGAQGGTVISSIVGGFFLYYAAGDYLTAHAIDVYDVQRIDATFATSDQYVLTNSQGGVYTVGPNEMILRSSTTGARYRVTSAVSIPAATGSPSTVTVSIQAIEAGAASSVAPGELDTLETPLRGVSGSNPTAIMGRDQETDDQLRKRCLAKKGTWSPFGPRDSYEYSALSATLPDGTPTTINRVSVSRYSSTGLVQVACATPNGTPTGAELDAVRALIEAQSRPDTVKVVVSGAVPRATTHTAILWAKGGTESAIRSNANRALAAFYSTYPIGGIAKTDAGPGYLYLDAVAAAIIASSPQGTQAFDVEFAAGSTNIALAWNEVATNTISLDVRIR